MSGNHSTRLAAIRLIAALALALTLWPAMARPVAAATYTVDTTVDENDSSCSDGDCSLRDAILLANNTPGADTIGFNIPGCGGVCTIQPASTLPALSGGGTTLDGYTPPGSAPASGSTPATLLVQIDGTGAGGRGFEITSANNAIRGLAINRFSGQGIAIQGSGAMSNTISGNYIGIDADGTADLGNTQNGIAIYSGARNNTVGGDTAGERNVISGNDGNGIVISGDGTTGNAAFGNYIGTNAAGTSALANDGSGVAITFGAQNNKIGGTKAGEPNLISGNGSSGVYLVGSGTAGNVVSGNYIGTDPGGTTALGNSSFGIYISEGQNNAITTNLISGNTGDGIYITHDGTTGNVVSDNIIGADANGTADLGNSTGVTISDGAQNNVIGGDAAGEGNLISGNDHAGVTIISAGTTGNVVSGNIIGADINGSAVLGNHTTGVYIGAGAQNNVIGGDTAGERNLISGNDWDGVHIVESGTMSNTVSGNYIGTNAAGTAAMGNIEYGVNIDLGAQNNIVGGTGGERNVISGNGYSGVAIAGDGTTGNAVSGNYIGTNANGTGRLGNTLAGVDIFSGAQNNTIGGGPHERNLISGNSTEGVEIHDSGTMSNTISGNYIGINAAGTAALGNSLNGVLIRLGAQNNTVGGATANEGNVISGNDASGVYITGSGTTGNVVAGNIIGANAGGTIGLRNARGVQIANGAQDNTIGPENLIVHNSGDGVEVDGSSTAGNLITQNSIFSNSLGIDLVNDANGSIAAPVIVTTTGSTGIVGTTCPNCTVEVFENSNTDGEGESYVASATATAAGDFTANVGSLDVPYLTATATDAVSGTSEFSAVFTFAPTGGQVYLPLIVR